MRGTVKHKQRRAAYVLEDEMRLKVVGTVGDATCSNIGEACSLAGVGAADAHHRRSDAARGLRRRPRDRQLHLRGRSWERSRKWSNDATDNGGTAREQRGRGGKTCALYRLLRPWPWLS